MPGIIHCGKRDCKQNLGGICSGLAVELKVSGIEEKGKAILVCKNYITEIIGYDDLGYPLDEKGNIVIQE